MEFEVSEERFQFIYDLLVTLLSSRECVFGKIESLQADPAIDQFFAEYCQELRFEPVWFLKKAFERFNSFEFVLIFRSVSDCLRESEWLEISIMREQLSDAFCNSIEGNLHNHLNALGHFNVLRFELNHPDNPFGIAIAA